MRAVVGRYALYRSQLPHQQLNASTCTYVYDVLPSSYNAVTLPNGTQFIFIYLF